MKVWQKTQTESMISEFARFGVRKKWGSGDIFHSIQRCIVLMKTPRAVCKRDIGQLHVLDIETTTLGKPGTYRGNVGTKCGDLRLNWQTRGTSAGNVDAAASRTIDFRAWSRGNHSKFVLQTTAFD